MCDIFVALKLVVRRLSLLSLSSLSSSDAKNRNLLKSLRISLVPKYSKVKRKKKRMRLNAPILSGSIIFIFYGEVTIAACREDERRKRRIYFGPRLDIFDVTSNHQCINIYQRLIFAITQHPSYHFASTTIEW